MQAIHNLLSSPTNHLLKHRCIFTFEVYVRQAVALLFPFAFLTTLKYHLFLFFTFTIIRKRNKIQLANAEKQI